MERVNTSGHQPWTKTSKMSAVETGETLSPSHCKARLAALQVPSKMEIPPQQASPLQNYTHRGNYQITFTDQDINLLIRTINTFTALAVTERPGRARSTGLNRAMRHIDLASHHMYNKNKNRKMDSEAQGYRSLHQCVLMRLGPWCQRERKRERGFLEHFLVLLALL